MDTLSKIDRILLVDDDEVSCYINHAILQKAGFDGTIDMAHDGIDALEYLLANANLFTGESPISLLVLLDINMPVMGGLELLHELVARKDLNTEHLYVVILSSAYTEHDLQQSAHFELADFLTKPLTEKKAKELLHALASSRAE